MPVTIAMHVDGQSISVCDAKGVTFDLSELQRSIAETDQQRGERDQLRADCNYLLGELARTAPPCEFGWKCDKKPKDKQCDRLGNEGGHRTCWTEHIRGRRNTTESLAARRHWTEALPADKKAAKGGKQ
jgi:hypothetical protein